MDASLQSLGDIAVSQSTAATGSAASLAAGKAGANIDKTSKDFESMFMTQMLQPMFEGLGADPVFGGGHGEEVMKSFLVQEYGKLVAGTGKMGLTSAVKNEMIVAQEKASSGKLAMGSVSAAYQSALTNGGTHAPLQ